MESQYDVRIVGCSGGIGGKVSDLWRFFAKFYLRVIKEDFLCLRAPISKAFSSM